MIANFIKTFTFHLRRMWGACGAHLGRMWGACGRALVKAAGALCRWMEEDYRRFYNRKKRKKKEKKEMAKDKMTRKEAILILHLLKQDMLTGAVRKFKSYNNEELLDPKIYDALNFAIDELKKDTISRDKAIINLSHLVSDWNDDWNVAIRKCIETIKDIK